MNYHKKLAYDLDLLSKKKDNQLLLEIANHRLNRQSPRKSSQIPDTFSEESKEEEDSGFEQFLVEAPPSPSKLKGEKGLRTSMNAPKQRICQRFFKLGSCFNGDQCEFAHSKNELLFNSPYGNIYFFTLPFLEWIKQVSTMDSPKKKP